MSVFSTIGSIAKVIAKVGPPLWALLETFGKNIPELAKLISGIKGVDDKIGTEGAAYVQKNDAYFAKVEELAGEGQVVCYNLKLTVAELRARAADGDLDPTTDGVEIGKQVAELVRAVENLGSFEELPALVE